MSDTKLFILYILIGIGIIMCLFKIITIRHKDKQIEREKEQRIIIYSFANRIYTEIKTKKEFINLDTFTYIGRLSVIKNDIANSMNEIILDKYYDILLNCTDNKYQLFVMKYNVDMSEDPLSKLANSNNILFAILEYNNGVVSIMIDDMDERTDNIKLYKTCITQLYHNIRFIKRNFYNYILTDLTFK
jgi:hypothetical protein